ncbi:MAG TPA: DMT family transporter [Bacillus sp. (in: firmicutes)]|uniref:DMT family transporter n=1 Tax=Bacillus litorisediminis TaxID=2922713 RepID=UPI001FADBFCD|nr:DMT family transporter [Bacillus litorisediminis]HWO78221.1 DMT family transporter [Bacillus sp. (in: firmicutes)]
MEKIVLLLLAVMGGAAVAMQSQVNGGLGRKIGVLEGSFISFLVGTLILFFAVLFFGKGNLLATFEVPNWQLIGGLLGALYVAITIFAVPKIGVASTLIAVVAGQIVVGAIIDHFGLFGGTRIPIDLTKLFAICLLFAAIYLFNK